MPKEKNQWVEAIARLTALTQEGSLRWSVDSYSNDRTVVGPTYRAEYKGRQLRLQKRSVKVEYVEGSQLEDQCFLEFVDTNDNSLWGFPEVDALEHLYGAVQYQTAGVKGFLDDLLSDT